MWMGSRWPSSNPPRSARPPPWIPSSSTNRSTWNRSSTGTHSHRTANKPLLPNPALASADPKDDAAAKPGTGAVGGIPTPGGVGVGPGATGGGAAAAGDVTPNNLKRGRYMHLTEQCRHMPVGMLVVVDQAHIHDVLIALANSRLRIQTTQVTFSHVRGITPPAEGEKSPEERRDNRPTTVGVGRPVAGPVGNPLGTGKPTGGAGKSTSLADEDDPNLVELAVYGIATLYERFPDNRPVVDAPVTGPTGTTPTGPASNPTGPKPVNTPMQRKIPRVKIPKVKTPRVDLPRPRTRRTAPHPARTRRMRRKNDVREFPGTAALIDASRGF